VTPDPASGATPMRLMIGAYAASTQELIQDGLTGLFYQSENAKELGKIEYSYDNPELPIILGTKRRDLAVKAFDIENYTSGLLEVINQAMGRP
jgi:hypothetical protein